MVPVLVVDDARRDGVDVNVMLDEIKSRALGEADDRSFRGAIDGDERLAATSRLRGEVDDLAAATRLIICLATACIVNNRPSTLTA